MQLHVLVAKAGGIERLDDEYAMQPVAIQDLNGLGQGVFAGTGAAVVVTLKCGGETPAQIEPDVAPHFHIKRNVDVHHVTTDTGARRLRAIRSAKGSGARSQGVKRGSWKRSAPAPAAPQAVLTAASKPSARTVSTFARE